jgi:hypothetical protein
VYERQKKKKNRKKKMKKKEKKRRNKKRGSRSLSVCVLLCQCVHAFPAVASGKASTHQSAATVVARAFLAVPSAAQFA